MMKKEEHTRPFDNHCRTPSAQEYKSKQKRIKEKGEEQRKEKSNCIETEWEKENNNVRC